MSGTIYVTIICVLSHHDEDTIRNRFQPCRQSYEVIVSVHVFTRGMTMGKMPKPNEALKDFFKDNEKYMQISSMQHFLMGNNTLSVMNYLRAIRPSKTASKWTGR